MKEHKIKALCGMLTGAAGITAVICHVVNKREKEENLNETEYVVGEAERRTFYEKYVKRALDVSISFCGLIVLSPIIAVSSAIVFLEDPGTPIFKQKRVGIHKSYFQIHKLRSMKQNCPDIPTHLMENPDQYILKSGKVFRKYSVDELTQLIDIIRGKMSIVGPRPALWNQDDLVAERDKYGANDVMPGLTGWAQINGRDELEIPVKAKLDGEYVQALKKSSISGFMMDCKCFFGTITSVLHHDGVVEGGTGEMHKEENDEDIESVVGFEKPFTLNENVKKKVLITGAGSYIGESFEAYAKEHYADNFEIDTLDMMDEGWREKDFHGYDIVYHVAGIAHADVGNVSEEIKKKYYAVNTDLAIETAKKAKEAGVKLFVFMSSMIIYGDSAPYGKQKMITAETKPQPANFYGDSKWQADKGVRALADADFKVAVLRPPMIYGKGSKGNYPTLAKMAKKLPVFPDVENQRSMLYIENLCEFLCQIFLVDAGEYSEQGNLFFPQNAEYTKTSEMVKKIAKASGKDIKITKLLRPAVSLGSRMHGKIGGLVNKAFGNSCYTQDMSKYGKLEYRVADIKESVRKTEGETGEKNKQRSKVLMLASVSSMIDQFNMSNINILLELGYHVDVACNFETGNTCSDERIEELKKRLTKLGVEYYQIDFTRSVMNLPQEARAYKQVKKIVLRNKYDFIHCHSPIGGVVGRIVAHETKTKVIYTAHGFHFFEGAPKKNWMIYYPIEKFFSKWTDILITINREDYNRAKKEFAAKEVIYIPGVGLDTQKFRDCSVNRNAKRKELGVAEDAFVFLSVGELQNRKNHRVVIEALHEINNPNIYYLLVGKGELYDDYKKQIQQYDLEDNIKLMGFRTDIDELCVVADCFIHPSIREGLGIAPLEAMSSGLPLISTYINGIKDYTEDGVSGCCIKNPLDVNEMVSAINQVFENQEFRKKCSQNNIVKAKQFDISNTNRIMTSLYNDMAKG